jgi:hypothetical protein
MEWPSQPMFDNNASITFYLLHNSQFGFLIGIIHLDKISFSQLLIKLNSTKSQMKNSTNQVILGRFIWNDSHLSLGMQNQMLWEPRCKNHCKVRYYTNQFKLKEDCERTLLKLFKFYK